MSESRGRLRTWIGDRRLARDERQAARAERAVEQQIRRERDNQETAERRAAAIGAERRRQSIPGRPQGTSTTA